MEVMADEQPPSRAPRVEVETQASHRHVLVIAVVGFLVGIAWPRLAGVSLVPEAPIEAESPEQTQEATVGPALEPEPELIELTPEDRLEVSRPQITSCVSSSGDKTSNCDEPDVDGVVHDHLLSLLGCSSATGVFGTLSLGFKLDFDKGKIEDIESGRSTDLPETTTKELLRCAERDFSGISVSGVPHQYQSYQVYYLLTFKTPEAAAQEKTSVTPASGTATVQWRTALIRDEPDRESAVDARILSGAVVIVTGRMGQWYRVKYDDKGREGWVHGAALGLKANDD